MKPLLTLALLAFAATLQTQNTETSSDLVVLKFSWTKYVIGSGIIHPVEADPAPGPLVINRTPTRDPNYQRPAPAPHERSAELATLEQKAAISTNKGSTLYVIRIQVKNTGPKPIKSFVWEYNDSAGHDAGGRQFLCAVKTKPNETKTLEILSPVAPSPVVDASKAQNNPEKNQLLPIINRIDYGDGSAWQRPGWESTGLSQNMTRKTDSGKCVRLQLPAI
jgi:hypothetical protein